MKRLAALAMLSLVFVACGTADTEQATEVAADPAAAAATAVATPTPAPTPTPTPTPVPPGAELVGRWAHYDVVAYQDDAIKTLIISYGFNDFSLDGDTLIDQASFCSAEQRTDQPIKTVMSDAATQAIQPPPTEVTIDEVDGTLRIIRPASPTTVGIELDDPFTESLPVDPNDPRIIDADGDGNPGITVTIEVTKDLTGEIYLARREIFSYEAQLVSPDRLVGVVDDKSEQLIIGASNPIFASSPANWGQHPDLSKSPVILVRVDDTWDCERLAAERATLFPASPEVDW